MKRYLESFENYFDARFHGSDKEKSQQLGKFLRGSAKKAFDAIGGSAVRYSKLKPKLLDWYHSERTSLRQRRLEEFNNCEMQTDDSAVIYCLRLENLASQAYP